MRPEQRLPEELQRRLMAQSGRKLLIALALILLVAAIGGYFLLRALRQPKETLPAPSGDELQVHVLNVGQGDSILIIAPGGKTVLVDAGVPGSGKVVMDALQRYGVKQIDLMVATHAHADHIGGADEVLKAVKVTTVLDSRVPNTTKNYEDFLAAIKETGAKYVGASPGQKFDLGGNAQLSVLAPIQPFFKQSQLRSGGNEPNANSVVTRLDYGDFSMLLTGDAEAETEERIMAGGGNVAAKVLKVGHHGSRYASSEKFLRQGGFEAAIISDGADNRYGHPSQDALDRLRKLNIKLYRTDLEGEITIISRGHGYEIKTERAAGGDLWAGRTPQRDEPARTGVDTATDSNTSSKQSKRATQGR
ncbi:MAG: competence protein ComEC [Blastocatellia bacterium]|jgi:beta-lactamase superfamily II metal-dependent hydrolase|nr:competence protein ComEC [Blastocatellia bacterium]